MFGVYDYIISSNLIFRPQKSSIGVQTFRISTSYTRSSITLRVEETPYSTSHYYSDRSCWRPKPGHLPHHPSMHAPYPHDACTSPRGERKMRRVRTFRSRHGPLRVVPETAARRANGNGFRRSSAKSNATLSLSTLISYTGDVREYIMICAPLVQSSTYVVSLQFSNFYSTNYFVPNPE